MATKLKVIKTKEFEVKGVKHKHYTAAYKGRVFGVSTLRVPAEDIKEEEDTITITPEVEVLKNVNTDPLDGVTKVYLDIVPKSGLMLAEF